MGFLDSIFGKGDPVNLEDQRTPEQIEAAKLQQQLATTGSIGGLTLGDAYTGSLGDFNPTQFEQQGLSQLFGQQTNPLLSQAGDVFGQLSQAAFDPSVLEPFRKAAVRSEGDALDRLSQAKAATGSRFGTGFGRDASDLIEGTELGIQQQLADLFLKQQGVSAAGAQGLLGVGNAQFGQSQQNLQNLFGFGSLDRQLGNQEAQANFAEFNRQRNEELSRVPLLQQAATQNPLLGISSLPGSASPFSQLISSVLGSAGEGFGERIGGSFFEKLFPKKDEVIKSPEVTVQF